MAKLNYMDRDNLLREFEVNKDVVSLGREANNDLVVADPSVSRNHAVVERRIDGYYLVDKGSSNGTFVNGKKVTGEQKLNHNDKVNLGSASLVFEDEAQIGATFILPRSEMPEVKKEPPKPVDLPTNAVPFNPPPPKPAAAAPPPSPRPQPAPPPPPSPPPPPPVAAPVAPPPPVKEPAPPAAPAANLCPACKKPVEAGARFCGFCGSAIPAAAAAPARPAAVPPPPPPAPAAARPAPPPPPPPPAAARPAPPPPPPAPAAKPAPPPPPPAPSMAPAPQMQAAVGTLNYATFGPRLLAYLIDGFILSAIMLIPAAVIFAALYLPAMKNQQPGAIAGIIAILGYLLIFVIAVGYQVYFIGAKGATPGKKIMKLKVTRLDGTYPIGMGKAFVRVLGYMINGFTCYIGWLMILWDKQRQGLHDKIAGTYVIKE